MADKIRFTDDEFDFVLDNIEKDEVNDLIGKFNDTETTYLRGRMALRKPVREGSQAAVSKERLQGIQTEQRADLTPTGQSSGFFNQLSGAQESSLGESGRLLAPQFNAEDVRVMQESGGVIGKATSLGGDPETTLSGSVVQAGVNIPGSAYNASLGAADLAKNAAVGMAGGALTSSPNMMGQGAINMFAERMGKEGLGDPQGQPNVFGKALGAVVGEEAVQDVVNLSLKSQSTLGHDIAGMLAAFVDLPIEAGKALIEKTSPATSAWLRSKGVKESQFGHYMKHDPVGTVLFMLPWAKGAPKAARRQYLRRQGHAPAVATALDTSKPYGGTLNKAQALKPSAQAFSEFAGYEDLGGGMKEAVYQITDNVANFKEGDFVSAKALVDAGYDVGRMHDRRTTARTVEQEQGFWREVADQLADELQREDLTPEQVMERSNELADVIRQRERAASKLTDEQQRIIAEETARLEEVIPEGSEFHPEIPDMAYERMMKLMDERQPGQPKTPVEITNVAREFPLNFDNAKVTLTNRVMRMMNEGQSSTKIISMLLDEAQLVHPEMSRSALNTLNNQHAFNGDVNSPTVKVDFLIDRIAGARAARGQTTTPLTTPNGSVNNAKVRTMMELGRMLESEYRVEIAEGDPGLATTHSTGHEVFRGEQVRLAYEGYEQGVPMRQRAEGGSHTFVVEEGAVAGLRPGDTVTAAELRAMGYEDPHVPAPHGDQRGRVFVANKKAKAKVEKRKPYQPPKSRTIKTKMYDYMTESDVALGADLSSGIRSTVARALGSVMEAPLVASISDKLGGLARNMLEATMPRYKKILDGDPKFYELLQRQAATNGAAAVRGAVFYDNLKRVFTENGKIKGTAKLASDRAHLFARYLNSERAHGIKNRNAAEMMELQRLEMKEQHSRKGGDKLTPEERKKYEEYSSRFEWGEYNDIDIPTLSKVEQGRFNADPVMQQARQLWKDEIQPFIEAQADVAGIEKFIQSPDGIYAKTEWFPDAKKIPKNSKVRNVKNVATETSGEGGILAPFTSSDTLVNRQRTRARASKRAKGFAPGDGLLSEDLRLIIHRTLVDRMGAHNKNALMNMLESMDYVEAQPGQKIKWGDGSERLVYQSYLDNKGNKQSVLVPEPIAKAYKDLTMEIPHEGIKLIDTWNRVITASALLVPAEATMHGLGVLHALATVPGIGGSIKSPILRGTAQYGTMVGRSLAAFHDMWTLQGPEFKADVITLSEHGALRTSHFDSSLQIDPRGDFGAKMVHTVEQIPVAGSILHVLKDQVFGMPELNKKGFKGMETRARVAMYRMIKKLDPRISDAKAAHMINDQMGTYVSAMEPLVAKKLRPVDPFVRAGTALTRAGIKSLGGGSAVKHFHPETMVATTSTILGVIMWNKQRTGHWPWEEDGRNKGVKPGDIVIGYDDKGKRIDIPFRFLANSLYRGFNMTGLREALDAYLKGETEVNELTAAWGHGVLNGILGRSGPPIRSFMAMGNRAPYLTRGGQFMQKEPPKSQKSMLDPLHRAFKSAVPAYGKWDEVYRQHTKSHPDGDIGKGMYYAAKLLGFEPTIRNEDYESRVAGSLDGARRSRMKKAIWGIVFEAGNVEPGERLEFVQAAIEDRLRESERQVGLATILRILGGLKTRYTEAEVKSRMARESGEDTHAF